MCSLIYSNIYCIMCISRYMAKYLFIIIVPHVLQPLNLPDTVFTRTFSSDSKQPCIVNERNVSFLCSPQIMIISVDGW